MEAQRKPPLFDATAWIRGRERACRLGYAGHGDFLMRHAARAIAERVGDVARTFDTAVLAGTGAGAMSAALPGALGASGAGLTMTDPSPSILGAAETVLPKAEARAWTGETLGFDAGQADLALSAGLLHWLEDPVGHLVQLRLALRPDGLLIAVAAGGETLAGLRAALATAEAEISGGLRPRVAPMGEIRDLGSLLQRAGLVMPVADSERLTLTYADAWALMRDLRVMGETNVLEARPRSFSRRAIFERAAELYAETHGLADGRVRAEIELVYLTGWSPGPEQPQPLRPGSARMRLADALGTEERPAGEKAGKDDNI
ncbi:MAG: methyltransferase domain-containing protein [Pseudomonadota bacterium]